MALLDARTSRVLFTLIVFALGFGFLYFARHTLVAFLFAIFFAYLVDPLVAKLEKLVRGRGRAIAIIYLLFALLLGLFFSFVGPRIAREGARFGQSVPLLIEKVSSGEIARQVFRERGWSAKTEELVESFLVSHREQITALAQRIGLRFAEVFQNAVSYTHLTLPTILRV